MSKSLILGYGVVSYALFLAAFLGAIAFVGNLYLPNTIDTGHESSMGAALIVNVLLLGAFAIQHSVMARPEFKERWTKIIPASMERSTYVLITSVLLLVLYAQWRPMTGIVWDFEQATLRMVLQGLFWLGWLIVFFSTFMINHFDLFGLRQVYLRFQEKEYSHPTFTKAALYKLVRHPIMLGFIIAFWATPTMTVGHLLFAVATTVYILIALRFEERDLVGIHGDAYRKYQEETSMILPIPKGE